MAEDLLDLVFEENEVIYRDNIGFKVGTRRKTTTGIFRKDRRVETRDEYGHLEGYAVKVEPLFDAPYVEFRDKDDNVVGKAYVREKVFGGREIEYMDKDGNVIATRLVDETAVARNTTDVLQKETSGSIDRVPKNKGGSSTSGRAGTGVGMGPILIVGFLYLFLCAFLHSKLEAPLLRIYYSLGDIPVLIRILCLYVPCPLMLLITAFLVRIPKTASREVKTFRIVQMVLATGAMLATVLVLSRVLVFWGNTIAGWNGFLLYLMGYAPIAIHALISRIRVSIKKRRNGEWIECDTIAVKYSNTVAIISTIAVFLARVTMIFIVKFASIAALWFFALIGWHILVAYVFGMLSRAFYGDM